MAGLFGTPHFGLLPYGPDCASFRRPAILAAALREGAVTQGPDAVGAKSGGVTSPPSAGAGASPTILSDQSGQDAADRVARGSDTLAPAAAGASSVGTPRPSLGVPADPRLPGGQKLPLIADDPATPPIEMLDRIIIRAKDERAPDRVVVRLDDGTYALHYGEKKLRGPASFRQMQAVAIGVLAGDALHRTHPHSLDLLAMAALVAPIEARLAQEASGSLSAPDPGEGSLSAPDPGEGSLSAPGGATPHPSPLPQGERGQQAAGAADDLKARAWTI